jgi:hypothetical protein
MTRHSLFNIMAALVVGAAASARACPQSGFHFEIEPNNTFATAQPIPPFLPSFQNLQIIYAATITPGDVDIFAVSLPAVSQLVVHLSGYPPTQNHAMQLAVFDSSESLLALQNQISFQIVVPVNIQTAGSYYIGVSGISDSPLSGIHQESFGYDLTIYYTLIPAPSAMSLLGLAIASSRRRNRAGTAYTSHRA